jgi:hypothetical protein
MPTMAEDFQRIEDGGWEDETRNQNKPFLLGWSALPHYCGKMPEKINLKVEGFILAHDFRGFSS